MDDRSLMLRGFISVLTLAALTLLFAAVPPAFADGPATDAEGNPETLTRDPTGEVAAKLTISGTAQVGETLTADTSGIDDELTNVCVQLPVAGRRRGHRSRSGPAPPTPSSMPTRAGPSRLSCPSPTTPGNEEVADQRGAWPGGTSARAGVISAHRPAHHRRHAAGGSDADGGHLGHRRR